MHIVLFHNETIPALRYGGTERVITWLGRALLQRGHQVTLIARKGSSLPGARVIDVERDCGDDWMQNIPTDADLVHLHATPAKPPRIPFLVTIHGNGQPGETFHPNTVFLSENHAQRHHSPHFVHNGLDPDEYPWEENRSPFLAFLAKASWKVKNLSGAIGLASRLNKPLQVMGSRSYPFELQRILTAHRRVRYLGMADHSLKTSILRRAEALLFPVRWHEPFGLAVIEALVSGCPVYGTPWGSLPELVPPTVGILGSSASMIQEATASFRTTPRRCREHVLNHFTHLHMADKYLKYYSIILNRGELPDSRPRTGTEPLSLLPWSTV